jgi:cytochrome c
MFDTMTMTKVLGAFCGSLLLYLLGTWGGELIYHSAGHKDGDHHAQGYMIEVADGGVVEEEPEEVIDIATMMLSAEAEKGSKVYSKCKACHKQEDGANGTGPHLFNVVNRAIGIVDGYGYSDALATNGGEWDYDALDGFLENPKGWAPGTKMGFAGLKKAEDRANLIAYLETYQ